MGLCRKPMRTFLQVHANTPQDYSHKATSAVTYVKALATRKSKIWAAISPHVKQLLKEQRTASRAFEAGENMVTPVPSRPLASALCDSPPKGLKQGEKLDGCKGPLNSHNSKAKQWKYITISKTVEWLRQDMLCILGETCDVAVSTKKTLADSKTSELWMCSTVPSQCKLTFLSKLDGEVVQTVHDYKEDIQKYASCNTRDDTLVWWMMGKLDSRIGCFSYSLVVRGVAPVLHVHLSVCLPVFDCIRLTFQFYKLAARWAICLRSRAIA